LAFAKSERSAPGETAARAVFGEAQDLGAVEGEQEPAGAQGFEELERHHRQHRAGLREVDSGFAQLAAVGDHVSRESHLAGEILGALQREAADGEGPSLLGLAGHSWRPNFGFVAESGSGFGDFLGERSDAAPARMKLVGDDVDRLFRCA